jgi:hypothetical protein
MSEYPEALVERVGRAIAEARLGRYEDAPAANNTFAVAALAALGLREEEQWTPVGVNGSREWKPRSKDDALDVAERYPREWTYLGEEAYGPNGIDHIEGERRLVFESDWEPIRD